MAREPWSSRRDLRSGEFGRFQSHRGRIKVYMLGRGLVCLIGAVFAAEALIVDRDPGRARGYMRLIEGVDGVETTSLAVSPEGSLIATTDTAGGLSVRDHTLDWQIDRYVDYPGFAVSTAFTPDGRFLAVGGIGSGIALWERESHAKERTRFLPHESVNAMAFSPDGRLLAAASDANTQILVWDWARCRVRMTLKGRAPVLSVAFSPDGRYLASGEKVDGAAIYVWDLETGRPHRVLNGSSGPVAKVVFSPDGSVLATATSFENGVRLWKIRSGRSCRMIAGHSFGTNAVAFSPDGRAIATAGNDGMVRLWSVETGEQRAVVAGQTNRLNGVAFSADGLLLAATGSGDNHVRVWNINEINASID
jgi:WD40 repeat protein